MPKKGPAGRRSQKRLARTLANEKAFSQRMPEKWPGRPRNEKGLARTLANEKAFTKRMLKDSAIFAMTDYSYSLRFRQN